MKANEDSEGQAARGSARGPLGSRRRELRMRWRVAGAILFVTLLASGACSLLVERGTDQCKVDADCKGLGEYSVCSGGICVKPAAAGATGSSGSTGSGGTTGSTGSGCFTGAPMTDPEFLNHCSDAGCEPFDNCTRVGLCGGAGLPALVAPPDGGV